MCEKFRRYTASVLGERQATAIVDAIGGLEQVTDMSDVASLLDLT